LALSSLLYLLMAGGTVSGSIRAEGSHEPVSAAVEIAELGQSVRSDNRGYFVIARVRTGTWTIRARAPGYKVLEREIRVPEGGSVRVDLELARAPVELEGIEVRSTGGSITAAQAGPGSTRLDPRSVKLVPALAEVDVLRAVQTLPSVAAASDFSSALYVRGGSPDQTLLLLDGVPLFNPYHLGGIFAAIDPDAVASVELLAGALPARVGDRLSGVVDVQTRDGGRDRVRASGSVGMLSSRATVDGPLPGGRGSYLVSARRTYVDLFTNAAHRMGLISTPIPYGFTDAHLKVVHDVGERGSVAASVYVDREGVHVPPTLDVSDDLQWGWGSTTASLRYRQPLGASVLGEIHGGLSTFGGTFQTRPKARASAEPRPDTRPATLNARTRVRDVLAGAGLTWYRGPHQLRGGVQLDSYLFDHDVTATDEEIREYFPDFARRDQPWTLAGYVEDEWVPAGALRLRAGVRVLHTSAGSAEWMPRVGATLALSPRITLVAGAGRYAQALHSIKDEESVYSSIMAYDFFAPVPRETGLAVGNDVVAGVEWASGATTVRLDAYAKEQERVPLMPVPAEPLRSPVLAPDGAMVGRGTARGAEILARHAWGKSALSLSYALASAQHEIGEERFAPRFERRHRLDASAYTQLGSRGQASLRLLWATGQPYTPIVGQLQGFQYDPATGRLTGAGTPAVLGEHNSARLPAYFRLDLSARRSFERRWFGRAATLTPYLQVLNALNTRNVLFAEADPSAKGDPMLKFTPQLPILPTIGVEWRF
jgi:hypothetical protein